jgi:hypothetical protein
MECLFLSFKNKALKHIPQDFSVSAKTYDPRPTLAQIEGLYASHAKAAVGFLNASLRFCCQGGVGNRAKYGTENCHGILQDH